jgi:ABC-2 type transport system permease protein
MRADPVLALPVSRLRWASSYLFIALLGPAVVLAALGLSMGFVYGLSAGNIGNALPSLLASTMVHLPAIWVLCGLAAALYGLLPRFAAGVSWVVLAVLLLLELAAELQLINSSVLNISPFAVTPNLPVATWTITPLPWLIVIAAILIGSGLVGFQHRDVG